MSGLFQKFMIPLQKMKAKKEEKPVGGRGKREALRNDTIKLLYKINPKKYNTSSLGNLFSRDPKTIREILGRELGVFEVK